MDFEGLRDKLLTKEQQRELSAEKYDNVRVWNLASTEFPISVDEQARTWRCTLRGCSNKHFKTQRIGKAKLHQFKAVHLKALDQRIVGASTGVQGSAAKQAQGHGNLARFVDRLQMNVIVSCAQHSESHATASRNLDRIVATMLTAAPPLSGEAKKAALESGNAELIDMVARVGALTSTIRQNHHGTTQKLTLHRTGVGRKVLAAGSSIVEQKKKLVSTCVCEGGHVSLAADESSTIAMQSHPNYITAMCCTPRFVWSWMFVGQHNTATNKTGDDKYRNMKRECSEFGAWEVCRMSGTDGCHAERSIRANEGIDAAHGKGKSYSARVQRGDGAEPQLAALKASGDQPYVRDEWKEVTTMTPPPARAAVVEEEESDEEESDEEESEEKESEEEESEESSIGGDTASSSMQR